MKFNQRLSDWNENKSYYENKYFLDPYFIAEIGVNHEGSIEKAKELIKIASESGANAVKFQSYKAERLTSVNSPAYWDTEAESTTSQYELFKKYDSFDKEEYVELKKYSDENNVEFLTTPFDSNFVDELDELLDFYKVASADITNYILLKKIASKRKPIILSTGASSKEEIDAAIELLSEFKIPILLNHCILSYPTSVKDANLGMIKDLKASYPNNIIGYSDHTPPTNDYLVQITSSLLGATFIEKHFTDDKSQPGNDHYHSFDPADLQAYKQKMVYLKEIYGIDEKKVIEIELPARENARRSLVFSKDLKKGKILSESDFIPKRPGNGIPVERINDLIEKSINRDVLKDSYITFDMLDE
jgi:N-acetylneuraminate synthase